MRVVNNKGFTIIELIIGLAVFATVMSIISSIAFHLYKNSKMTTSAEQIAKVSKSSTDFIVSNYYKYVSDINFKDTYININSAIGSSGTNLLGLKGCLYITKDKNLCSSNRNVKGCILNSYLILGNSKNTPTEDINKMLSNIKYANGLLVSDNGALNSVSKFGNLSIPSAASDGTDLNSTCGISDNQLSPGAVVLLSEAVQQGNKSTINDSLSGGALDNTLKTYATDSNDKTSLTMQNNIYLDNVVIESKYNQVYSCSDFTKFKSSIINGACQSYASNRGVSYSNDGKVTGAVLNGDKCNLNINGTFRAVTNICTPPDASATSQALNTCKYYNPNGYSYTDGLQYTYYTPNPNNGSCYANFQARYSNQGTTDRICNWKMYSQQCRPNQGCQTTPGKSGTNAVGSVIDTAYTVGNGYQSYSSGSNIDWYTEQCSGGRGILYNWTISCSGSTACNNGYYDYSGQQKYYPTSGQDVSGAVIYTVATAGANFKVGGGTQKYNLNSYPAGGVITYSETMNAGTYACANNIQYSSSQSYGAPYSAACDPAIDDAQDASYVDPDQHKYKALDIGKVTTSQDGAILPSQEVRVISNAGSGNPSKDSQLNINNAGMKVERLNVFSHYVGLGESCTSTQVGTMAQQQDYATVQTNVKGQMQCVYNPTYCTNSDYCYLPLKNNVVVQKYNNANVATCPSGTYISQVSINRMVDTTSCTDSINIAPTGYKKNNVNIYTGLQASCNKSGTNAGIITKLICSTYTNNFSAN